MRNKILLFCSLLAWSIVTNAAEVIVTGNKTATSYSDSEIVIEDKSELRLSGSTPLVNSTVNLKTETSWLYFLNLTPTQVISKYLKNIKINGVSALKDNNVRVEIYVQGAVVIPHPSNYQPLEAFTDKSFQGTSKKYGIDYHKNLGEMDGKIRSFKLKKGYMATFATSNDGSGYSRVFVADAQDLELSELQPELDQTIAFIRVFKWRYVSKKGHAGGGVRRDSLRVSWYYDWGAGSSSTDNYEFSPMRHFRHWDSWSNIESRTNSTAVLGFNEPWNADDHKDQTPTTMSEDECIQLWPNFMRSGLRIGSPAPTDGNSARLLKFIQKADSAGYRIDFVCLHFYRGGQSAQQFYSYIKSIHDQSKRPIWVTEWNNGANWTTESWPSDKAGQQAEQLKDITAFTTMLDTASFVERYAIYNNVEEKRYLIYGDSTLTPAGVWYQNNKSVMAYNPVKQYVPKYVYKAPVISSTLMSTDRTNFAISMGTNPNGKLATALLLERKTGDGAFEQIDSISNSSIAKIDIPVDLKTPGDYTYRLRFLGKDGKYTAYTNTVGYSITEPGNIIMGSYTVNSTDWNSVYLGSKFENTPCALLGPPTGLSNSSTLLTQRVRSLALKDRFDIRVLPWSYQTSSFRNSEFSSFLLQSAGNIDWGGIIGTCQSTTVKPEWTTITFPAALPVTPVVLTTLTSSTNSIPVSIRIRNVTTTGFEVRLVKESAKANTVYQESFSYLAVTPGRGMINERLVVVGNGVETGINALISNLGTADFKESLNNPLFFATMQTANDEYGAELRIKNLTNTEATFYKQTENSGATAYLAKKEMVGWMAISNIATGMDVVKYDNRISVYPNPSTDVIYFPNDEGKTVQVRIYNLLGKLILQSETDSNFVDVRDLSLGNYLLKVNESVCKFIKK